MADFHPALARDGHATLPGLVPDSTVARLLASLGDADRHGVRNLIADVPAVADLCRSGPLRDLAASVLGPGCFAARGILFDKTPGANWKVPWHQDLTIAVRHRRDQPGYGPWSVKAGVHHVQPPADLLGRMLTLRLHLDPCGPRDGPLRVLPGSHRGGRLDLDAIGLMRQQIRETTCVVDRGGVVVMRPLLLHASSPSEAPGHRRVVNLEFAAEGLPGGLEWHGRW